MSVQEDTMFKTIISTTVGLAATLATVSLVAPDVAAKGLDRAWEAFDQLSQPDCDTRPRACLLRKQDRLSRLDESLKGTRADLEAGYIRAVELHARNNSLLGQNQMYLEQARRKHRDTVGEGPIIFAGETYPSKQDFRHQMELLFIEGKGLESVVADAQITVDKLATARRNLIARRSEIQATLSLLPAKLALLDAQQSYAALEGDLNDIDGIMERSELDVKSIDVLLRSTSELAEAEARAPATNTDFEAWLNETTAVQGG